MRLLVVEDEKKLCDMIAKSLHLAGYEVDMCNDGEQALEMIYAELYDLIVLDLNLPGVDGMEILRELRKENEETKVLILSARSQIADKVEGLDSGANDYMEKPFHLQELEARVRSLTRRKFIQKNICLECGKLRFDTRERVAYADDNPVALTRKENGILEYLLLNQGRPVSQEELIEHVWDSSVDSFSGSIRVHMSSMVLARRLPFPKDHVQLLSGLCGAFCFAMMFGGNLRSALAAAGAGLVASWYLLWCGRHEVPGGFQKISTAALITLVCILLCNLLHTSASHAIIGTLMILTPGIAFTMGIRDFVQGDYLSGTIRMIDALLIAASIAIGTGLVLRLYTVLTGVVVV